MSAPSGGTILQGGEESRPIGGPWPAVSFQSTITLVPTGTRR
jgi:hypothetical protein